MEALGKRHMLARIHIAKRELDLADADYRAILGTAGLSSAADIAHPAEFQKIMDAFQRLGYQPSAQEPHSSPHFSPQIRKKQQETIKTLWIYHSRQKTMPSLEKFIYRMFKKEAAQLSGEDAATLITAIERL